MKAILLAAISVLATCRNEQQSESPPRFSPRVSDSVSITAIEDSLVNEAVIGGPGVITPNGDTLSNFGGSMMEGEGADDYGVDHYTKNGTWYVRVQQMTS